MNGSEAAIQDALIKGTNPGLLQRVEAENRIIPHNFRYIHECLLRCDLEGCGKSFPVMVIPGQVVYPRYCEEHRTEHRRKIFTQQRMRLG